MEIDVTVSRDGATLTVEAITCLGQPFHCLVDEGDVVVVDAQVGGKGGVAYAAAAISRTSITRCAVGLARGRSSVRRASG